jgi:hypothetical protein
MTKMTHENVSYTYNIVFLYYEIFVTFSSIAASIIV